MVAIILSLQACSSEYDNRLEELKQELELGNFLSNFNLLFEHGYYLAEGIRGDDVYILFGDRFEDIEHPHMFRIEIRREFLDTDDFTAFELSSQISTLTGRTPNRQIPNAQRRRIHLHRLDVESEPLLIGLIEDTTDTSPVNLLDELERIIGIVNAN